jgi:KDO2-lipid IV(A) lauroyltransferase
MKNPFFKKVRNTCLYLFIQALRFLIFFIPWKAGRLIGEAIGVILYYLVPKERNKIFSNLDIVFGQDSITTAEKKKFAMKNCRNFGIGFFEFAKFSTWSPEKISGLVREVEGAQYFETAIKEGRPYIGVTAHLSNWEILPVYVRTAFKWKKVGAIGKKIFDPRLEKIVNSTRLRAGYEIFDKDNVSRDMIKGLKNGSFILGMLVDQDTNVESKTIQFMGIPAKTPVAPAILAKKYSAYIGTVFIIRRDDGYYKMIINKPVMPGSDDSVEMLASKYNDEISAMIRQYPLQWVWIHERWKNTFNKSPKLES